MKQGRLTVAVIAAAAAIVVAPGTAYAGIGNGDGHKRGAVGGPNGQTLMASVTQTNIQISSSGDAGATGKITAEDPNWTPPVCWYEPVATPDELKSSVEHMDQNNGWLPVSIQVGWGAENFKRYLAKKSEFSPYDDYATSQQGKGMWWRGVLNPNHQDEIGKAYDECQKFIFWAPNGAVPNVPQAVSPQILAGYAYDAIRVPDAAVETNPQGKQTVNLPTWIWLDKAKFKPVSVTARLPGAGLWATTTAKPVSLHIEPGTPDADVYPSSRDCPISADGSIGSPYAGDPAATPPCGLTYRRSSASSGSYQFKATITWQISWTGSGNTGGDLPNGTFGTTTPVTVQEIQTVVR